MNFHKYTFTGSCICYMQTSRNGNATYVRFATFCANAPESIFLFYVTLGINMSDIFVAGSNITSEW